jgi:hypothetical protein
MICRSLSSQTHGGTRPTRNERKGQAVLEGYLAWKSVGSIERQTPACVLGGMEWYSTRTKFATTEAGTILPGQEAGLDLAAAAVVEVEAAALGVGITEDRRILGYTETVEMLAGMKGAARAVIHPGKLIDS